MHKIITIDFNKVRSIGDLLEQVSPIYALSIFNTANINIIMSARVEPEYLVIVVGIIRYLRVREVSFSIHPVNHESNTYPQRMNFYRHLGVDIDENFNRLDPRNRFVEITKIDGSNNIAIVNEIMRVIRANCFIRSAILECLNYCFFEVVDNIDNHAMSLIDGYTAVQYFPTRHELRLVLLDAGRGIHASLIENNAYAHLTPAQALEYCIRERVTNGRGQGIGLYHTSRFIQENGGEMRIYSDHHQLLIMDNDISILPSPYWKGTLIYIKINTRGAVDQQRIFGTNIPASVQDAAEYIDELW